MSHVPNDVPVEDIEKSSFLVYHTSDGFLTKYGSSLQSIYRDHTSLTSLNMLGIYIEFYQFSAFQKSFYSVRLNCDVY